MLNPRYQSVPLLPSALGLRVPPRASWPYVVANESEKFSWNTWPPARFSSANAPWLTPGS